MSTASCPSPSSSIAPSASSSTAWERSNSIGSSDAGLMPSMLNKENDKHPNPEKKAPTTEYLPTPVTPAGAFPKCLAQEYPGYGAFALQKAATPKRPTPDKPFACHECDQAFSRPHNLKSHLATHSSERPFQCGTCKLYFRRHHDLKRHQKLHTGERPYVCQTCNRSFARLDALNRHQRSEGSSACSDVHPFVGHTNATKFTPASNTDTPSSKSLTAPRPMIPQLQIPHPASRPVQNEVYPHPPSSLSPPNTPSNSNLPVTSTHSNVLPSPSALPNLPVSESTELVPIQVAYSSASLPSSNSQSPSSSNNTLPEPYRSWTYSPDRSHPPSRRLPLPTASYTILREPSVVDRLEKENQELRQQIARLNSQVEDTKVLHSRIHDLEIENKVLRSLIVESGSSTKQADRDQKSTINEEGEDDQSRTLKRPRLHTPC
ncbi:uncharacterized protein BYT42DRAFT_587466 [Radiomyces spectabilis]|uniref:uncharacterized protein n=1 Tax=Radiomyces spectabilis TaxID=64574 RepID=UPI00221F6EF3|nr:uncharacterized protein BYT42DRAFT_587466 [Radiomyces spectabilis]KAI8366673.1 hypothetical protein BYT42DRAFT_587466 [Radiomyces spectabilis]